MIKIGAPLYRDPIYDGASDPAVIYNRQEKVYYMFYTQRRSFGVNVGVASIHGTEIGIAVSEDLSKWLYRGTAQGLEFEKGKNTFWAPEVIYNNGIYHMYVSYVQGIPTDWNYERHIIHYTSENLWDWKFEKVLELSSNRVIDACVYEIEPGLFKMWYKDEVNGSHTYGAVSRDLYNFTVTGEEISDCAHEGPNVFELGGKKWMITDAWDGMGIYETEDYTHFVRQEGNILRTPGSRNEDGQIGNHGDVLVLGDSGYLFYFVHPEYSKENRQTPGYPFEYKQARTVIQMARIYVENGRLVCNRDEDIEINKNIFSEN